MSKKIKKKKKKKSRKQNSGKLQKTAQQEIIHTPGQAFNSAVQYFQAGNLVQAEKLCKQLLEIAPEHAQGNNLLGIITIQMGGDIDIAVELIRKAINAEPGNAAAYNNLGNILHESGKLAESIASYREALSVNPGFIDAKINLGVALKEAGEMTEAEVCLKEALSKSPDNSYVHNHLGSILKELNQEDEAIKSFEKALAINPNNSEAYKNLGNIYHETDRLDEAIISFRKSLSIKPDNAEVHNSLGIVYKKSGKMDEAIVCYRNALLLDPKNVNAYNNLGNLYQTIGNNVESMNCFNMAIFIKPDFEMAHRNLGKLLHETDKLEEAIASYKKALSIKPELTHAHVGMGAVLRELGRLDEAAACFRKALSIDPGFSAAYKNLAMMTKYAAVDDDVLRMEELYTEENITENDKKRLGFSLGKVFEDLEDYERSFKYIYEANLIERKSYEYSIKADKEIFERIKTIFSSGFFAEHEGAGCLDETPIFILGMPRSGTTLIEQILASHPQVFGAGELTILARLIDITCSDKKNKSYPECIAELDSKELIRLGSDYIEGIKAYSKDTEHITDKMPHNFLRVGLIRLILPNAKIIHCLRDPMDSCFSIFKKKFQGKHDYAYDMAELGQYYRMYQDLMAHWGKVLPGFMYTIRYEEMVADQKNQSKQLLEFCGLPWDKTCLDFHKTERNVRTASFMQVRQPIYKDSVQRWKRYENQLEPLRRAIYG